ncbi:MAG: ABC transporter substrate-binding protein [Candidatus Binatia bacterium]
MAIKRGFFKDEGLEVEVIRMNTPTTLTAMMTGDVGYTLLFGSVVRAALRGLPIRALASLLDSPTYALIARAEYKTLKNLKGKTVGIANFGGTDEVLSKLILKAQGSIRSGSSSSSLWEPTGPVWLRLKKGWWMSRSSRRRAIPWAGRWASTC